MADTKITALTALTGADPANDVIPIVDVSDTTMAASGTTKKISVNNILGASGTATLASATITGDLTVDTSTLKVDSANNRVGIGTASPGSTLDVAGETRLRGGSQLRLYRSDNAIYTSIYDGGSGVGTVIDNANGEIIQLRRAGANSYIIGNGHAWYLGGGAIGATLDSSGNLGLGVTPSAWVSYQKAIDFGGAGNYGSISARANYAAFATNCYFDGTNWVYKNNNPALQYEHSSGQHIWRTAGAGTGNITFTQAMTLDASGNLLVGTTSAAGNRLNVQTASGDCTALIKSQAANVGVTIDYVSNYGNFNFSKSGTAKWSLGILNDSTSTPTFKIFNDAAVGVYVTYGGTSWTATSDERLKDIIEPIGNAVEKVASLRSVIGKFKNDQANTRRSFLIAQDVQSVLPEAVDASNPDKLGVAYSEVIPLLVAAIKELTARVQTLETR
jgi:hypothetical protein